MATAERQTTRDLADTLLADAKNYSFFRLLEHLHELHGDNQESEELGSPSDERVRLTSHAGLGFPASDVASAQRLPGGSESRYNIEATFFGLHGADSPLPGYYIDTVAFEAGQGIGIRPAFLDFFNHRLLTLLHRGWRKYRYHVRFRHEAKDRFSRYVFSLIGLNDEHLRGSTPIPWSRLLTYSGLIASRSRSPAIVAGIIAHCFDLQSVHIREFDQRYVDIHSDQRHATGVRNGTLGTDFVLGGRVSTRSTKFTIVIQHLDQQRFREFLPSGINFERLRKLIEFLLRDPMSYDLELGLLQQEIPPFALNRDAGAHLGWTSFVGDNALRNQSTVKIKGRL